MPKPKPKTLKPKSLREPISLETKPPDKPNEEPKEPPELPWSDWIWDGEQTIYYRAKLGADKRWLYEYAAGPPPISTLSSTRSAKSNPPITPSNTLPIKCTKEDLELKIVYAPEPAYTYDIPYTAVICDDMVIGPGSGPGPGPDAVKAKVTEVKIVEKDKAKDEAKKDGTNEKKDTDKSPRPSTPKISHTHRQRLHKFERVEAYIEGLDSPESGKRKDRDHKHSELRGRRRGDR